MNADLAAAVRLITAEKTAQRVADYERRQAAKATTRAEKKTRRDFGLIQRHARKLARRTA